jgi:hypothetical protein
VKESELLGWAENNAGGAVAVHSDYEYSLTSKIVRFVWKGAPAVAGDRPLPPRRLNPTHHPTSN